MTPTSASWLTEKRRLHLDQVTSTSLPPRGLKLWRYTDPAILQPIAKKANSDVSPLAESTLAALHNQLSTDRLAAVVVDRVGAKIEVMRRFPLLSDRSHVR